MHIQPRSSTSYASIKLHWTSLCWISAFICKATVGSGMGPIGGAVYSTAMKTTLWQSTKLNLSSCNSDANSTHGEDQHSRPLTLVREQLSRILKQPLSYKRKWRPSQKESKPYGEKNESSSCGDIMAEETEPIGTSWTDHHTHDKEYMLHKWQLQAHTHTEHHTCVKLAFQTTFSLKQVTKSAI